MRRWLLAAIMMMSGPVMAQNCPEVRNWIDGDNKIAWLYASLENMRVMKCSVSEFGAIFTINLIVYSPDPSLSPSGVAILFTDGTVWSSSLKVEREMVERKFQYSASLILTPEDIILFTSKPIKKYALDVYPEVISLEKGEEFRRLVQCVQNAK
jgi:hypothetical protein